MYHSSHCITRQFYSNIQRLTYHTTIQHYAQPKQSPKSSNKPSQSAKSINHSTPTPPGNKTAAPIPAPLMKPYIHVQPTTLKEETQQYKHISNPYMQEKIIAQFKLHCYDSPILIGVSNRLRATGSAIGLQCSGIINIPMKVKRFTLLRSPHVDKHSRTQLEVRTYRSLIEFVFPSQGALTEHYVRVVERLRKNLPQSVLCTTQVKHILQPHNWSDTLNKYHDEHPLDHHHDYDPLFDHPLFLRSRSIIHDNHAKLKNNYIDL